MKCPACPVAGIPAPCIVETGGHRRYCDHAAAGHCGYRRVIHEQSTGEPAPFACPEDVPEPPPVGTPPQAPLVQSHEPSPRVPLAVSLAVVNCPVRGAPLECGCAAERRYCGDTLDLMVWDGCVACKQATCVSGDASDP